MNIVKKWPIWVVFLGSSVANAYNCYALWLAAAKGEINTVQEEINAGADACSINTTTGQTALMAAAYGGHLEVVKELLKNGANFNAQDRDGYTALMFAPVMGSLKVIQELLKAGVQVNTRAKNGQTALSEAMLFNCPWEIEQELLRAGANINDLPLKKRSELIARIKASIPQVKTSRLASGDAL